METVQGVSPEWQATSAAPISMELRDHAMGFVLTMIEHGTSQEWHPCYKH